MFSASNTAGDSFGFGAALRAARASIEESAQILRDYEASGIASAAVPLFFDSRRASVLAYASAMERVRERFWTTTFLASGFWSDGEAAADPSAGASEADVDILGVNLRMMASCRSTGAAVRRLVLLPIAPETEIQRLQSERMALRKFQDHEGLARFDRRIANLADNMSRLLAHGCDVRVICDRDNIHLVLPPELGIVAFDTELAIYDDWRFDLFQGGQSGSIESVRGYTPVMSQFAGYLASVVAYFEQLWQHARPMADFIAHLQRSIDYSTARIDYDTSWLTRYDHALSREDEALKVEELSGVRFDLVRLDRWGRVHRLLDVGTCTGRYPLALRDAVRPDGILMGVDNDVDCVRFTQAKIRRTCENDRRLVIERHDFCSEEPLSNASFDLITCMLGTICHFPRRSERGEHDPGPYDDALQRALEKFARLLVKGGLLFFSVWTEEACRQLNFLTIYTDEDKQRLARMPVPRGELRQRLEAVGFRISIPIMLQDRMEMYRCERS